MSADPSVAASELIKSVESSTGPMNNSVPLQDAVRFENLYSQAVDKASQGSVEGIGSQESLKKLLSPLTNLNDHSDKLKSEANLMIGDDVTPGQMMQLTMRAHEFMFHCELTSNIANRSSDGIQQLFKQQS